MKKQNKKDAYDIFHNASQVFVTMETNGIRIDKDKVEENIKECKRQQKRYAKKVMKTEEGKKWQEIYGSDMNLFSGKQLSHILYKEMKYPVIKRTDKGLPATDVDALTDMKTKFTGYYVKMKQLDKIIGTYLGNFLKEEVNGRIHPFFNLHTTKSMRTSGTSPNLQNIPARDPFITPLVRQCIIASEGNRLVEIDYGQLEVRVSAMYHKDPVMIEYLINPDADMHLDCACDIFKLEPENVSKMTRFFTKNKMVFAAFYGSYYAQIAADLWKSIERGEITDINGDNIIHHLKEEGIGDYPLFEDHLKEVERIFWEERFCVYNNWKKKNRKQYTKDLKLTSLTGFDYYCFMSFNDSSNWSIQGTASNICVWSLCRLQEFIEENNLKTKIINTVHDSILLDMPDDEMQIMFDACERIMTKESENHFGFFNVPLVIEIETSQINGSWHDKEESTKDDTGIWIDPHNK